MPDNGSGSLGLKTYGLRPSERASYFDSMTKEIRTQKKYRQLRRFLEADSFPQTIVLVSMAQYGSATPFTLVQRVTKGDLLCHYKLLNKNRRD